MPPPTIRITGGGDTNSDSVIDTKHKRAEVLIPQNLSEGEKQILRDFYNYN